jgi:hypothetical protein
MVLYYSSSRKLTLIHYKVNLNVKGLGKRYLAKGTLSVHNIYSSFLWEERPKQITKTIAFFYQCHNTLVEKKN